MENMLVKGFLYEKFQLVINCIELALCCIEKKIRVLFIKFYAHMLKSK